MSEKQGAGKLTVKVSPRELSEMIGVSYDSIRKWISKKGCPIFSGGGRGKKTLLDVGDVARWYGLDEFLVKCRSVGSGEAVDYLDCSKKDNQQNVGGGLLDVVRSKELSQIMGLSYELVRKWPKEGCPVVSGGGRGKAKLFDLMAVAEWYGIDRFVHQVTKSGNHSRIQSMITTQKAFLRSPPPPPPPPPSPSSSSSSSSEDGSLPSYEESRARKTEAEARIKEIQLSLLRGDTVSLSETASAWTTSIGSIRTRFLGLGNAIAPQIDSYLSVSEKKAFIDSKVRDILSGLCSE